MVPTWPACCLNKAMKFTAWYAVQARRRSSGSPTFVRYEVEVEGGAWVTGELRIQALGGVSRVTWREEGDFGRNPLMGYVARGMAKSQGAQLAEGLEKLAYIF